MMNFKEATGILFKDGGFDPSDLASSLVGPGGRKVPSEEIVRAGQGEQEPPSGWEFAISRLAIERIEALAKVVNEIDARELKDAEAVERSAKTLAAYAKRLRTP